MDLTNRVEMLETELIAMKLCKLKMEADKTQVELHAKQMEKTLSALQAAHSSGEAEVSAASAGWKQAGPFGTIGMPFLYVAELWFPNGFAATAPTISSVLHPCSGG